jgi:hypothetical protein
MESAGMPFRIAKSKFQIENIENLRSAIPSAARMRAAYKPPIH